jgi:hypothetical protein
VLTGESTFDERQCGDGVTVTEEERAFGTLTLLVAVAEQALADVRALDPPPEDLIDELALVRDDVVVVAKRLIGRDGPSPPASAIPRSRSLRSAGSS